ncbi:MAG TPA: TonB-dependent receptor [Allosphingosinicella sp.]|nr:TonB-dependent receptor [Allosphingosinicella sp.]
MRLKTVVLCSTSFAALAVLASPAAAQGGQPDQPVQQTEDVPNDTDAAPPQTDDAVQVADAGEAGEESIVVTGLRRSLQSAQNIKRNSDQVIDAIVAEDIGKLPDIAVSDTAARIPGVQVERGGGEAGRVLVRGLPDFTTTYNGREIFTAETRSVALQDFPSGAIGAIEVFKTSTANLVEPGLAGLVNVRSRRPFDFDGFEIAGSVWGLYTYQADEVTPNGNILITNRWDVGGGEIGALIGFSYTRLRYLDSTRENTDFVAGGGPNGTRWPDVQRVFYGSGDRTRPSINAALQYRPAPGIELYAEGLWQGFRNRVSDRMLAVPHWGGSGFTDFAVREGRPDLLESATVTDPFRPDGFQGGTFNKTNTYQFAVGGSYDAGPVRISADIARTDSTFTGSTASVDYAFANRQTVIFDTDVDEEDGGAEFDFASFDPSNPANYVYRGFYEEAQVSQGDDWQARLDLDWDTGSSFLPEFEVGVRFTDRDAHREFGSRYWGNADVEPQRIPLSDVPLDYVLFRPGFRGSDVQPFRTWLSPTYRSIRDNIQNMRQFTIDIGGTNFTLEDPLPDPLQTWDAAERNLAAYAQVRYEFPLGGEATVDGNIGLRVVRTSIDLSGTRLIFPEDPDGDGPIEAPPGVFTATEISREFTDWLPNISARLRFNPQLQLRLSFTQTRTRPGFTDLRPSATIDRPPSCLDETPLPENCIQTGRGGNPFLDRLTSDNYDASLEWFFSRTGFASVAVFYRDMNGFIETTFSDETSFTGSPLRFEGPINSGAGRIKGFEAQLSTFFDFGGLPNWLSNFGVQANVTHIDARADFVYKGETVNRELVDVSPWSYNLIGMYEAGGFSARIAWNRRSGYLDLFAPRDNFFDQGRVDRGEPREGHLYIENARPLSRLDLSASFDVMEHLTVFADWTNILKTPFRSTLTRIDPNGTESTFPRFVRFNETTVSVGARFRF